MRSGDIVLGPSGGRTWDLKGQGIADLSCQHSRVAAQFSRFALMSDGEVSSAPLWLCLFWPSVVGKRKEDIKSSSPVMKGGSAIVGLQMEL